MSDRRSGARADSSRRVPQALTAGGTEQIGVDTATITNWELGHTTPALWWMPHVIRFLGYDPQRQSETIGQALKRHRPIQGIPQRELGSRLGVDPGTLGRWKRGERMPTGKYRVLVEAWLGA